MQVVTQEVLEVSVEEETSISPVKVEEVTALQEALAQIDINDRKSIIYFGSSAQEKLDEISNRMIEGVQNKDIGGAGTVLTEMVMTIRGFDMESLDPNQKQSWWKKFTGAPKPLAKFLQEYEDIRDQIDVITNNLEKHKSQLMVDIVSLDKLYDANMAYFRDLEIFVTAGETKLLELSETIIPAFEAKTNDNEMMRIQDLKEIRGFKDELERRVHDLRLSRQVTMQSLPSIRLIQENDKSLISKITSTMVNTVPLWRNQLAQTVTIFRSHDTAKALKVAGDLTNELLERNAQGLRDANYEIRTQMERGIFDMKSIKKANETFIATLDDSLKIAEEGKAMRASALIELNKTESELKDALLRVKAKEEAVPKIAEEKTVK